MLPEQHGFITCTFVLNKTGAAPRSLLSTVSQPIQEDEDGEDDLLQMQTPTNMSNARQTKNLREKVATQNAVSKNTHQGGMTEGVDRLLAFSPPRNESQVVTL